MQGVGDLDGDGRPDAACGGLEDYNAADIAPDGVVHVLYGAAVRPVGATPAINLPRVLGGPNDALGAAIGGGDLDGDELSDLAMASIDYLVGGGYVGVLYGDPVRPAGLDVTTLPAISRTAVTPTELWAPTTPSVGDPGREPALGRAGRARRRPFGPAARPSATLAQADERGSSGRRTRYTVACPR